METYLIIFFLSPFAFAMDNDAKSTAQKANDKESIQKCLANWETHPFGSGDPKFAVVDFGNADVLLTIKSKEPQLTLIRGSLSALSKKTLELLNPKGWYCLDIQSGFLAKATIELDCRSSLTTPDGTTVLAGTGLVDYRTEEKLKKYGIERIGCQRPPDAPWYGTNKEIHDNLFIGRSAYVISSGTVTDQYPSTLVPMRSQNGFSMHGDLGMLVAIHLGARFLYAEGFRDQLAPPNSKRMMQQFTADLGLRIFAPFNYIQPYFGGGKIHGFATISNSSSPSTSGLVDGETRWGTGDYSEVGVDISPSPAPRGIILRVSFRRETFRTSSYGNFADFGYVTNLVSLGIGGK